jgi:nucleotide-binding universal stress UspA family protein
MNEYKHILVVSRMIQSSRIVIQTGISLARKYQSELYVIHSVYNPFGLKGWSLGHLSLKNEYEKILLDAKLNLSKLVEAEKSKGISITELVMAGEPTAEILKTIAAKRIDLLILLAHQEDRLENLFFNQSNNELTRKMPCSIMLVKQEATPSEDSPEEDIDE